MATLNYRYHFHISVSETTAGPTASRPEEKSDLKEKMKRSKCFSFLIYPDSTCNVWII